MMERTESCFFVKQSLPKGLMGAFLLFCVDLSYVFFLWRAHSFIPVMDFCSSFVKRIRRFWFFIVIMTRKGKSSLWSACGLGKRGPS